MDVHPAAAETALIPALVAIAGAARVLTSPAHCTFYATDIASPGVPALAVVQVADAAILARVVRACTERGHPVIPRGGGFSYTGGYTPTTPGTVIVDLRPMDRIVEINAQDMYVVVEAGCTWRTALRGAEGRRASAPPISAPCPATAPPSAARLSQGSLFLGSTQYGTVAESQSSAWKSSWPTAPSCTPAPAPPPRARSPFFRQYGPDPTGMFLNDTGAMGFKTRAVLRLIPFPPCQAYGSFAFNDHRRGTRRPVGHRPRRPGRRMLLLGPVFRRTRHARQHRRHHGGLPPSSSTSSKPAPACIDGLHRRRRHRARRPPRLRRPKIPGSCTW